MAKRKSRFDFVGVLVALFHDCGYCHSYQFFPLHLFAEQNTLPPLWVNLGSKNSQAMGYIATKQHHTSGYND
jgi:hypothetical protein